MTDDWQDLLNTWRTVDVPRLMAGEEVSPPPHPSMVRPQQRGPTPARWRQTCLYNEWFGSP